MSDGGERNAEEGDSVRLAVAVVAEREFLKFLTFRVQALFTILSIAALQPATAPPKTL